LNKILITIQGRTLILYYLLKRSLPYKDAGPAHYITVLPSDELSRFNLHGLTPEMFCVNIADMVNFRKIFSGQVENERQFAVAKWDINHDAYLKAVSDMPSNLTHQEIVKLVSSIPAYIRESDGQYIDFEERIAPFLLGGKTCFSGYRLTIVTENIEGDISSSAYFNLGIFTQQGWQDSLPPPAAHEAVHTAVANKVQAIRNAGVPLLRISEETDYALADSK